MYTALAASLPVARPYPNIPEGTEIMDKMGTEVSLVMTGDKSPEEAAEDMEARVHGGVQERRIPLVQRRLRCDRSQFHSPLAGSGRCRALMGSFVTVTEQ